MPNSIERLFDVEESCCAVLFKLEARGDDIDYPVTLLDSGVEGSKAELMVGNYILGFNDGVEPFEE